MKKILPVLLVSIVLFGCSEDRVPSKELINKGNNTFPLMYYKGKLYNGIEFGLYSNGQLKFENNYKDGKKYGLQKAWHSNGQVELEGNYNEDLHIDGVQKRWKKNGHLIYETNWKDGKRDGLWEEAIVEVSFKDGSWGSYKETTVWLEGEYEDGRYVY